MSDDVLRQPVREPDERRHPFLNPTAFAQPAVGTFGNMQRNIVRGPDSKNLDLALTRAFKFVERPGTSRSAIEAFNAFNWFEWGNPNTAINAATFGQITSTSARSRRASCSWR